MTALHKETISADLTQQEERIIQSIRLVDLGLLIEDGREELGNLITILGPTHPAVIEKNNELSSIMVMFTKLEEEINYQQ